MHILLQDTWTKFISDVLTVQPDFQRLNTSIEIMLFKQCILLPSRQSSSCFAADQSVVCVFTWFVYYWDLPFLDHIFLTPCFHPFSTMSYLTDTSYTLKLTFEAVLLFWLHSPPPSLRFKFIPILPSKRKLDTSSSVNQFPSLHLYFSFRNLCKHNLQVIHLRLKQCLQNIPCFLNRLVINILK